MFYEQCEHEFVDHVCIKCDLVQDKYFGDKSDTEINYRKAINSRTSILDNLTDIPKEVISKARQNIYKKQDETGKKVRNDAKNTFIIIYEALLECGYNNFNPHIISNQLKLSRKEVNWCLKVISKTSLIPSAHDEVNKNISIVIISPVAYIEKLTFLNNIEEFTAELQELTKRILKEKDILYSSRPEYVACGIIKKFCDVNGISTKSFGKVNKISDNALKKAMADIEEFF